MNKEDQLKQGQKVASLSAAVVGLMAGAKATIGFLSGSIVLLSDALHSGVDLLPVFASWFGLKIARRKPDQRFPYGYYKAENIATIVVAIFVVSLAFELFRQGYQRLFLISSIKMPIFALGVSLLDAFILYFLGNYETKVGQAINSQSLIAIGQENKTHLLSSMAVFGGILSAYYQIPYVEGIITIILSLLIFKIGLTATKDSLFALMDVSPSQEIESKVTKAIKSVPGIEEFWNLRLRKAGPFIFGETKVGIRKFVNVKRGHEIAERIEKAVRKKIPQLESFIVHVEPFKSEFHHLVIPVKQKKGLDSPLSDLFGRAPYFLFINLKGKTMKGHYFLKNPYQEKEVRAGLAAVKLATKQKSDTLITKKVGEISFYALRDNLFDIYQTTAKTAATAINQFSEGSLKPITLPTQKND